MRIRRTVRSVLPGVLLGLLWMLAAIWLGRWSWALATLLLALALIFFVIASGLGEAACPWCGRTLRGLYAASELRVMSCLACRDFIAIRKGELGKVPDDYVHRVPLFGLLVRRDAAWPEACCECGAAATRKLGYADPSGGRVEIPYCAQHSQAVEVRPHLDEPSLMHARFRSYAYYRAFRDLNLGQKLN